MSEEHNRGGGVATHLPGIFQGLMAAAIGGALAPGVAAVWQRVFRGVPPEWKGSVPSIAGALALPVIYFAVKGYRRVATRRARATPDAKGDRLSIVVARFGDDKESSDARECVVESIRKELPRSSVEIIPSGSKFSLTEGVSEDQLAAEATKKARTLLHKKHGDILIWGKLRKIDGKTKIGLRFVVGDEAQPVGNKKPSASAKISPWARALAPKWEPCWPPWSPRKPPRSSRTVANTLSRYFSRRRTGCRPWSKICRPPCKVSIAGSSFTPMAQFNRRSGNNLESPNGWKRRCRPTATRCWNTRGSGCRCNGR
jgi:hypothetical protein